jgi:nitrate reductase NapAB chaperone NapD
LSILGVVVRSRPDDVAAVRQRLSELPGLEVAIDPGDGRLIIVIEDAAGRSAASTLAEIALMADVLNTSLVYEYSGADASSSEGGVEDYGAWRASLTDLAARPTSGEA